MSTLDRSRLYGRFAPPWTRLDGVAVHEQDGKMFGPDDQELSPEINAAVAALAAEGALTPALSDTVATRRIIAKMIEQGFQDLPLSSATFSLVHEAWVNHLGRASSS